MNGPSVLVFAGLVLIAALAFTPTRHFFARRRVLRAWRDLAPGERARIWSDWPTERQTRLLDLLPTEDRRAFEHWLRVWVPEE